MTTTPNGEMAANESLSEQGKELGWVGCHERIGGAQVDGKTMARPRESGHAPEEGAGTSLACLVVAWTAKQDDWRPQEARVALGWVKPLSLGWKYWRAEGDAEGSLEGEGRDSEASKQVLVLEWSGWVRWRGRMVRADDLAGAVSVVLGLRFKSQRDRRAVAEDWGQRMQNWARTLKCRERE